MKNKGLVLLSMSMALLSLTAHAATITVKMLNQGSDKQPLVFEPAFIKASVGDTVSFAPMEKGGHTGMSLLVPKGANPWKAVPDQIVNVKIEKEGVYLVACDVHKMMGMVAVIQAGKATNLQEAKAKAAAESAKMATGKDRYAKLLAMVK